MLDYDTPATVSKHFYNDIVIRAHVHTENGTIWLVGADVCKALQITNPSYVASKLDKANVKRHYLINSQGKQLVTWYSPRAIYKLCQQSKSTRGLDFLKWYASIQSDYVLIPRETMLKLFDVLEKLKTFI